MSAKDILIEKVNTVSFLKELQHRSKKKENDLKFDTKFMARKKFSFIQF